MLTLQQFVKGCDEDANIHGEEDEVGCQVEGEAGVYYMHLEVGLEFLLEEVVDNFFAFVFVGYYVGLRKIQVERSFNGLCNKGNTFFLTSSMKLR